LPDNSIHLSKKELCILVINRIHSRLAKNTKLSRPRLAKEMIYSERFLCYTILKPTYLFQPKAEFPQTFILHNIFAYCNFIKFYLSLYQHLSFFVVNNVSFSKKTSFNVSAINTSDIRQPGKLNNLGKPNPLKVRPFKDL